MQTVTVRCLRRRILRSVIDGAGLHCAFEFRGMVTGDVVLAAGELDIAGASTLVDLIAEASARVSTGGRIVLDLADVSFLDVGGLRALHRVDDLATRAGIRLELQDPSPAVLRVLALCDDPWYEQAQARNR